MTAPKSVNNSNIFSPAPLHHGVHLYPGGQSAQGHGGGSGHLEADVTCTRLPVIMIYFCFDYFSDISLLFILTVAKWPRDLMLVSDWSIDPFLVSDWLTAYLYSLAWPQ